MKNQDFIQNTAEKIIESLKNGTAPWIKPWKADELNNIMPYNPTTNKNYNGINTINLMMQGYSDPRWLTYKQAQELGAYVKKGEKSTSIQYWQFSEMVDKVDENGNIILDENGKSEKIEIELETPKVFFASVFNAEQCENLPKLEQKPKIDNFKVIKEAQEILDKSNANIKHDGSRAFYNSFQDTITLPNKSAFIDEIAYYSTALHELGHWSGHQSRLNRDLAHPFGTKEYAKEELRAEIASFLLCAKIGLDYDPSNHLSYIDGWVSILENKPYEIFKATSDATKIANFLEDFTLEQKLEIEQNIQPKQNIIQENREQNMNNQDLGLAKEKTYLYVPYKDKDEAKKLGAKWDKEAKSWYADKGADLNKLEKWLTKQEQKPQIQINEDEVKAEFIKALNDAGLDVNEPIMDGKLHRVRTYDDKGRNLSGAYVGFLNAHPAGHIQNFKTGYKENWKSSLSLNQTKDKTQGIQIQKEKNTNVNLAREEELLAKQEASALKAQEEYNNAKWAYDKHPYLQNKGLEKNYYLKQDEFGNLLIPLSDIEGKHWTSQRIFSNGDKMIGLMRTKEEKEQNIEYPSKKTGNFFIIGAKNLNNVNEIFVCEGFATAASVYEATKKPTVMAVDAGNLEVVITNIKEKYPKMQITIAADNDVKRELENKPNVGKTKAYDIKNKYKDIKVVLPQFTKEEIQKGYSDFNDLMRSRKLLEVTKQIKEQLAKQLTTEKALNANSQNKDKAIDKKINITKDIGIGY